jgi:FkbM family methyltransferase
VPDYAVKIHQRFRRQPLVSVHAAGLAPEDGTATLTLSGDASSHVRGAAGEQVEVELLGVDQMFDSLGQVDLMKVNIEGAEYDLLDRMLDTGLVERVRDLQVQFHDFVPDARRRMLAIREGLSVTHSPTYQFDFVWENWRLDASRSSPS